MIKYKNNYDPLLRDYLEAVRLKVHSIDPKKLENMKSFFTLQAGISHNEEAKKGYYEYAREIQKIMNLRELV